jgi:hypothetical protein
VARQPAISFSISFQPLFNRAGGRTSNVVQKNMKTLAIGITLLVLTLGWLIIAGSWGESPLEYNPSAPWYHAGQNLNTILFHLFSMVSSGVFGAGIALRVNGNTGK